MLLRDIMMMMRQRYCDDADVDVMPYAMARRLWAERYAKIMAPL